MKILLIDDHRLFSDSIKMILELDIDIEKVDVLNEIDSLELALSKKYDLVLIDINLSTFYKDDGLKLAETILEKDSDCKILILTGYKKQIYLKRAKEMGTYGFVDKSIDSKRLLNIIKLVYRGKKYFFDEEFVEALTNREINLLNLIRIGLSGKDICKQENISRRTLSNHLSSAMSKLGANNRQEAIYKAEKLGYFPPQ